MPSMSFDSAEVPLTHPNEFNISELDLHKNDLNTSKSDQLLLKRFRSCVLCLLLGLAAISYGLFIFSPNPANSLFSHVKTDTFSISGRKHSNGDYFLGIPYAIGHPFMNAHGYKYKLPVVVYFTAGDTQTSSLSDFVPSVVIKQYACRGVVVVYVNYRVNMFGFFSTGTPGSGNVALYDAKLALEWVRTHIEHFGGNSRDVTVIGTAMGARIVSLMGRIPRIRHLYHKAILLSGSSFVPFMVQDFAYGQHRSRHLALSHNCANDQNWPVGKVPKHPVHIVKCLRSSNISNNIYMNEKNLLPWHFMIDDDLVGPDLADPTNMLGLSVPLLSIACLEKPLSPSHKIPLHTVQAAIKEVKQLGNRQLKSFREYYLNLYSKNGSLQNGTNIGISNKEVQNGIFDDFLITGPSLMEAQATAERNMLTYLVTVYGRKKSKRLGSNPLCLGEALFDRLSLKHWYSSGPSTFDSLITDAIINFVTKADPSPTNQNWPSYNPFKPEGIVISGSAPAIVRIQNIPSAPFWICKIAYELFEISHLIKFCNEN